MPQADIQGRLLPLAAMPEGERVMRICNACRYCEGFCAVFPAMERRLTFGQADLNYLANLCHDCGECFYSCQYAPPHDFDLDLPRVLGAIRRDTYRRYAWPAAFGVLFDRQVLSLVIALLAIPAAWLLWLSIAGPQPLPASIETAAGDFYQVVPHDVMVGIFSVLGALVFAACFAGTVRCWRDLTGGRTRIGGRALWRALADAASLRYLDGGGDGCAYPGEVPSQSRRWFHHFTFYGFLLCFAATTVAAFYHNVLGWPAPYPLRSVPVVLGSIGGIGLIVGPLGLLWLKMLREAAADAPTRTALDITFLLMLLATSVTGFLLLAFRETAFMGILLAIHLGVVTGLFATLPYGKFVHALYRTCALVKFQLERHAEERAHAGRG